MEEKKKIKYFIDFDDTIFNTNLFGHRLFAFLKALGFSEDERIGSYTAVYDAGYAGIMAHLDKLAELHPNKLSPEDLEKAKAGVGEYLQNSLDKYLFPQTLEFLCNIDKEKYDIYLITVGNTDFQKAKVEGSEVANYFDPSHIIYTDTIDKDEVLSEYVGKDEHFILLDDKQRTLDKIKEKFLSSLVVQANGGELLKHIDPEASLSFEGQEIAVESPDNDGNSAVTDSDVSKPADSPGTNGDYRPPIR